jgi:nitrilase
MKEHVKVAVVQDSSVPFDPGATARKTVDLVGTAARNGAELIVFPEAFLGTYPKGLTFDAPIGTRLDPGRDDFLRYYNGAVEMAGPEMEQIAQAAADHDVFVVLGIIERSGFTLYCTAVYIDGAKGIVGKHRKLMPTGAERLVWGFGDGSTLDVVKSDLGTVGAVICWENYMPLLRTAMYAQGVEIYCAPTADNRDTWAPTMRHVALEGRCFVLSACQYITRDEFGSDYRSVLTEKGDEPVMRGGSLIVGPMGDVLAGPVFDERTVLYADPSRDALIRSKFDFDVVGHYARPDVFALRVDRDPKQPVV